MIMFVLALIGSLLPLVAVATLLRLTLCIQWDSFLKVAGSLSGLIAGIIAIAVAVLNGIWQDSRQRKDRLEREQEKTQQMLQEKAEEYCLASLNLIAKCRDFADALQRGKDDLLMQLRERIGELQNCILLLEHFQLAFLGDTIEPTSAISRNLVGYTSYIVELLGDRHGTALVNSLELEPIGTAFGILQTYLFESQEKVRGVTERIPNLNLYKLYAEWRKKHPLG